MNEQIDAGCKRASFERNVMEYDENWDLKLSTKEDVLNTYILHLNTLLRKYLVKKSWAWYHYCFNIDSNTEHKSEECIDHQSRDHETSRSNLSPLYIKVGVKVAVLDRWRNLH